MSYLNPMLLCDFYKISHREQYPEKTENVYSTWTPRSNKHAPFIDKVVACGFQGFIKEFLIDFFNENFFKKPKNEIIDSYKRILKYSLGIENPDTRHIEDLHDLGNLPLEIKAIKEGTLVPFRVPMMTITNTDSRFYWLPNYVETLASCVLWKPSTSASIAVKYKEVLDSYAMLTTGSTVGVEFQGHDFSMRGLSGPEDAARTGFGHLVSGFVGTDTIPAIMYAEKYYNANVESELVGCSVSATEHSVMCAGTKEDELETYRRIVEDIYPSGIVSIVSDTWDLWNVLTNILPELKDKILSRDGGSDSLDKVVIRPDSGDPADILCGLNTRNDYSRTLYNEEKPETKGVIELLWDLFGGSVNEFGYKVLNPAVGAIYGDAITIETCKEICKRLAQKGFASTNVIYGIGSFTYQYVTRDTLGFAMKATSVTIDGEDISIFKDPITDDGTKKSAKGKVYVVDYGHELEYLDDTAWENGKTPESFIDLLEPVFLNGILLKEQTLSEIRELICDQMLKPKVYFSSIGEFTY